MCGSDSIRLTCRDSHWREKICRNRPDSKCTCPTTYQRKSRIGLHILDICLNHRSALLQLLRHDLLVVNGAVEQSRLRRGERNWPDDWLLRLRAEDTEREQQQTDFAAKKNGVRNFGH